MAPVPGCLACGGVLPGYVDGFGLRCRKYRRPEAEGTLVLAAAAAGFGLQARHSGGGGKRTVNGAERKLCRTTTVSGPKVVDARARGRVVAQGCRLPNPWRAPRRCGTTLPARRLLGFGGSVTNVLPLRSELLIIEMDVSICILVLDTFIFKTSNSERRK